MPLKIDLGKTGFHMVLKPYQLEAMKYLWSDLDTGRSSREVYDAVNLAMKEGSISRASIINSLNALVDDGALSYLEITGKGGHRRIYKAKYDEEGFKRFIADKTVQKLLNEFPEQTKDALESK